MIEVKVNPGESINTALARFKKKCNLAKIPFEIRRRRFYEKPSTKRRRLALKAQRRQQRRTRFQRLRSR